MFELQEMLKDVTGMAGVSLAPMAGAQGEFAGVAMIRAYHDARGDTARTRDHRAGRGARHQPGDRDHVRLHGEGNPHRRDGNVDLAALRAAVGPQTAGLMLTNPSTLGVFEKTIADIQKIVHDAGGLLYYDGANLNAILGKVRPGDMGFDVIHMNLHKTFSTPHGGGGPGAGPVGVAERLLPFLPIPLVLNENGFYRLATEADLPQSIGRLSANMGNAGVLLRAYVYARMLGGEGMHRVAEYATLNANYLMARLREAGFDLAFPERRASHEFIVTLKKLKDATGVSRDGLRQAPARLRLPRADHLLPAAGAGVPADRADRDREPRDAGRLRRGDDQDQARSRNQPRTGQGRALQPAGAAAGRRQGGARTRSGLQAREHDAIPSARTRARPACGAC